MTFYYNKRKCAYFLSVRILFFGLFLFLVQMIVTFFVTDMFYFRVFYIGLLIHIIVLAYRDLSSYVTIDDEKIKTHSIASMGITSRTPTINEYKWTEINKVIYRKKYERIVLVLDKKKNIVIRDILLDYPKAKKLVIHNLKLNNKAYLLPTELVT